MQGDHVLVSVATGRFNNTHQDSKESILKTWPHDVKFWVGEFPPGSPTHEVAPYAFKAFALKCAMECGYSTVTWVDSSIHVQKDPSEYIDQVKSVGYYFQHNGFSCANTCTDAVLKHFGVTRDEAVHIPEVVGGIYGLHRDVGRSFISDLVECAKLGLFTGNRVHDTKDSQDPRFLFCRHDQSIMSLLVHQRGWCPQHNTYFDYRIGGRPHRDVPFVIPSK
jgi:hypothetical protein